MRLRWVWFSTGTVLAILAAYYAGYRKGLERNTRSAQSTQVTIPGDGGGDSDRTRPVPSSHVPLSSISQDDYRALLSRDIEMPLQGIKPSAILDTFNQGRGGGSRRHEATDIMAPRGTPIHAVADGTIKKLFFSNAGGITIYEFDPQEVYCYYYAHLDRYVDGLHESMNVKKGDVIGYVGSTGDASREAPHLHFAIEKLGPEKKWWQGTAINPYPLLARAATR